MTDINTQAMGSLCCSHCNTFHPSSEFCKCEASRKYRGDSLLRQLASTSVMEENKQWEFFRDASYYDMFCVRPKGSKTFGVGFHLVNEDEASGLCDLLNGATVTGWLYEGPGGQCQFSKERCNTPEGWIETALGPVNIIPSPKDKNKDVEDILERLRDVHRRNPSEYNENSKGIPSLECLYQSS